MKSNPRGLVVVGVMVVVMYFVRVRARKTTI